jgi:hypothetical protein
MKRPAIAVLILWVLGNAAHAQAPSTADQVVEGSKVIVELVKIFKGKKDVGKDSGCKGSYADICVNNGTKTTMMVSLVHRSTEEVREVVILPGGKECSLKASVGVWTYDVRPVGAEMPHRKGDLLLEGCNNIDIKITE